MKSWWSAHGGNEIQIIRDGWVSSSTSFLLVFRCRLYWRSTDGILNAMYLFFNVITLIKLNHPRVIWDEFAIILTRLITSSSFHFSSSIFSLFPEMRNLTTQHQTSLRSQVWGGRNWSAKVLVARAMKLYFDDFKIKFLFEIQFSSSLFPMKP